MTIVMETKQDTLINEEYYNAPEIGGFAFWVILTVLLKQALIIFKHERSPPALARNLTSSERRNSSLTRFHVSHTGSCCSSKGGSLPLLEREGRHCCPSLPPLFSCQIRMSFSCASEASE